MNNPASAILPPAGLGDRKPANQAVLDWVHEVELLTQPENIFWCDGSAAENEFLISESLKQNVLFKSTPLTDVGVSEWHRCVRLAGTAQHDDVV